MGFVLCSSCLTIIAIIFPFISLGFSLQESCVVSFQVLQVSQYKQTGVSGPNNENLLHLCFEKLELGSSCKFKRMYSEVESSGKVNHSVEVCKTF